MTRVGRQTFAQQILARDRAIGQIDVGGVIDDAAVDLLGNAHDRSSGCRPPCGRSGILRRLAGMTARQLLVSPSTSSASGALLGQQLVDSR